MYVNIFIPSLPLSGVQLFSCVNGLSATDFSRDRLCHVTSTFRAAWDTDYLINSQSYAQTRINVP